MNGRPDSKSGPPRRPPGEDADGTPSPKRDGQSGDGIPPAGPHADPDLTDLSKTPGAGTLPDPEGPVEPGTG
jgi:hypothetical protein